MRTHTLCVEFVVHCIMTTAISTFWIGMNSCHAIFNVFCQNRLVASLCKNPHLIRYIISPFCLCQDLNVMWHFLQTLQMSWNVFPYWLRICISHSFPCKIKLYTHSNMMHSYVLNLDVFSGVLYIYMWVKQNFMFCTQLYSANTYMRSCRGGGCLLIQE
jgi:hypothetical protein